MPHGSLHLVLAKNRCKSTELTVQALPQRDRNMRASPVESRCELASEQSVGRLLFSLYLLLKKIKAAHGGNSNTKEARSKEYMR